MSISNDNKTTVATLTKLGSHRSAIRQKITSQILQELRRRNCTFEVHHIPGREIVLADFLSRNNHLLPTEVQLSQEAFLQIMRELDLHPEVDLFSTKFNNKLPNYHSAIQDGSASHINIMTANWANYQNPICLSSTDSYPQDSIQMAEREKRNINPCGARLADQKLVFITPQTNSEVNKTQIKQRRPIHSDKIRQTMDRKQQVASNRSLVISNNIPKEFSRSLRNKLIKTNRASTEKHYETHWRLFVNYLKSNNLDLNKGSLYEFFNHLIDRKLTYGSILQYRSAITKPLRILLPEVNLLQDKVIKDLLQYTKSHTIKSNKSFPFWDLNKILEMFNSIQFKTLCERDPKLFFKKVLFLVLLASSKRINEFKAISISKSFIEGEEITLRTHPKFIKKNADALFNPEEISFLSFPENKEICPVYNLKMYLDITDRICAEKNIVRPDQLFIKEGETPFTTHQLRSSVREIIIRTDPLAPRPSTSFHSVRKATSTLLDYRGFNINQILNKF